MLKFGSDMLISFRDNRVQTLKILPRLSPKLGQGQSQVTSSCRYHRDLHVGEVW